MVSQRQRLARKRLQEANPDLFPKPQPTPKGENTKTKKKKIKNKNKSNIIKKKQSQKPGSLLRKHPLRVPGMRPGESCFICKSTDHIAKLCPEKSQWENNKSLPEKRKEWWKKIGTTNWVKICSLYNCMDNMKRKTKESSGGQDKKVGPSPTESLLMGFDFTVSNSE